MTEVAYETDFYAWLLAQVAHLRAKQWNALDVDNLAEEIDTLGRSERHAVWSHLRVLLLHLLKWCYQPERREVSANLLHGYERVILQSVQAATSR